MSSTVIREMGDYTVVDLYGSTFRVANHWFWKKFDEKTWEPETFSFYKRYTLKGFPVIDIGSWIGPTALIAVANGASYVKLIEANIATVDLLTETQELEPLLGEKFQVVHACVLDKFGKVQFGLPNGELQASSGSSIKGFGSIVESITYQSVLKEVVEPSVIKIDIEGTEEKIIHDIVRFSSPSAAIWLSMHPPFFDSREIVVDALSSIYEKFHVLDSNFDSLAIDDFIQMIVSDLKYPSWGTEWGNFFEVALLDRSKFEPGGLRHNAMVL